MERHRWWRGETFLPTTMWMSLKVNPPAQLSLQMTIAWLTGCNHMRCTEPETQLSCSQTIPSEMVWDINNKVIRCTMWGRKKILSAFLISLAGSENSTGRERLSGEKHKHLFHVNFMQHRSLHKEMKTQRDRPVYFILGFLFFNFWLFIFFGYARSSLLCRGFLHLQRIGATLQLWTQASHHGGFSCCRAKALGLWAQ